MSKVFSLLIVLVVLIGLLPQPVHAATTVSVPAGTRVALQFRSGLDSSTAKEGQRVNFRVAANVIVNRLVVIREGASARGTITDVTPPGVLGKSARIIISFVTATAVDSRPVRLSSIYITPNDVREAKDVAGAAGAATVGMIILGPIGLAAAALVRGGHVVLGKGTVAVVGTVSRVRVRVG
jgi:hypothetical protein